MKYIHTNDPKDGIEALAHKISSSLKKGKKVLWLVPGGSNIPLSVDAMSRIRSEVAPSALKDLTVMLTDERYGEVGHKDSNWKQLIDAGFAFDAVRSIPVLNGSSREDTVFQYGANIENALKASDIVIGQFGVGADGHIAGILPRTKAVSEARPTCAYESGPFIRITLTPPILRQIDAAYAFVFGPSKKQAIDSLVNTALSIDEEPVQILKQMNESFVYSDQ